MRSMLLLLAQKQRLSLSFASGVLPSMCSFARSSSGSCVNEVGILENRSSNTPRFDYDAVTHQAMGLIVEPQRTNILTRSWRLSSWNDNASTSITANDLVAPDGTQTAYSIVADNNKGRYIMVSGLASSAHYALSGFLKRKSGSGLVRVGAESVENGSGNGMLTLNPDTGSITANGSGTYDRYTALLPNGWIYFRYRIVTGSAQTSFPFVAYSNSIANGFSLWGVQVEALANSTDKASTTILTDSSALTRAADIVSFAIRKGIQKIRFWFDDDTTQDVDVSNGLYTIPTTLRRARVKRIKEIR